jgi:hypothetical protein
MKRFLLCHLSLGLAILSAETPQDDTRSAALRLPDPASIRFTPPPPPKEAPSMEVKASTTADFGTHRITILRGAPSTLPDMPKPPPPVIQSRNAAIEPTEPHYTLFIGGSAYSDTLSHVHIWNPFTGKQHDAWCGWDVSLLSPFQEIIHDGKKYNLFMGVCEADLPEKTNTATDKRPEVKPGSIVVPDGDAYTAALLTSMRAACNENMPKLLELQAARQQYQRDYEAWKAANPQRPQNHTIWIKPHRGSRYLNNSTAAQKEGTR